MGIPKQKRDSFPPSSVLQSFQGILGRTLQEYHKEMLRDTMDFSPYLRMSVLPKLWRRFCAQRQVFLLVKSVDVESTGRLGLCKSGFRAKI